MAPAPAHQHGHGHEAFDGPVVLDVGGDVGALVLRTDPAMLGDEIEIAPVDDDAARSHVAVHRRSLPGGHGVHAAVYPALREGTHRLWHPDGSAPREVVVRGGAVLDVAWSDLSVVQRVS